MTYEECDFGDLKQCALLYGLTLATARTWSKKSVEPVPWDDPRAVVEWYRVAFNRSPGIRVLNRVEELGPQWARAHGIGGKDTVTANDANEEVGTDGVDVSERVFTFEEICGLLANAETIMRIALQEKEAFEVYDRMKRAGKDHAAEFRRWSDLTKAKREWVKTPDAVELAGKVLREWVRSDFEIKWKGLRTMLDGRRLGLEAREALIEVADDPLEWRRVWDMEMERAIAEF